MQNIDLIQVRPVVEDVLSEAVIKRCFARYTKNLELIPAIGFRGKDFILKHLRKFNEASRLNPYLVLIDLDDERCPPSLLKNTIDFDLSSQLVLRVVIREIESWILADRHEMSVFLSIPINRIPSNVEEIGDPKRFLVNLARNSRSRDIQRNLVPGMGSTATVGPGYNSLLSQFVMRNWDARRASNHSNSLARTLYAIEKLAGSVSG